MKTYLKSLSKVVLITLFLFETQVCFSQDSENILLQAISPSVTIRQFSFETSKQENFTAYYSAKHNEILLTKLDFERFPDSNFYLVKARFTMYKGREFKDSPVQTFIQITYYYLEKNKNSSTGTQEVDINSFGKPKYPRRGIVKDVTQKDINTIHFVINESSQWIMDNTGKPDDTIIYVEKNKDMPIHDYALMITNLKKIIVDGKKVN